jgi:hypothetical protein
VVENGKEIMNIEQGISNVEGMAYALFPSSFEIPCSIFIIHFTNPAFVANPAGLSLNPQKLRPQ